MKTFIKITFVAFAIAITAAACDPAKKPADSTKIDSTAIAADSTKKDTTVIAPVDSTKKDSVKK